MGRWLPINHEGCIDMREGMEAKETESVGILGSLGLTEVKHSISCICDMFFLFCIFLFPEINDWIIFTCPSQEYFFFFFFAVVAD